MKDGIQQIVPIIDSVAPTQEILQAFGGQNIMQNLLTPDFADKVAELLRQPFLDSIYAHHLFNALYDQIPSRPSECGLERSGELLSCVTNFSVRLDLHNKKLVLKGVEEARNNGLLHQISLLLKKEFMRIIEGQGVTWNDIGVEGLDDEFDESAYEQLKKSTIVDVLFEQTWMGDTLSVFEDYWPNMYEPILGKPKKGRGLFSRIAVGDDCRRRYIHQICVKAHKEHRSITGMSSISFGDLSKFEGVELPSNLTPEQFARDVTIYESASLFSDKVRIFRSRLKDQLRGVLDKFSRSLTVGSSGFIHDSNFSSPQSSAE